LESLLQRSEVQLEEELAKGDEADMKSVTEIRDGIARIREELKELKKNK
jgi:DNA-binding helix-hairpin-helix protein with protein kinase domain